VIATWPMRKLQKLHHETMKVYRLVAHSGARGACEARTSSGFTVKTDLPRSMGGANSGPEPVEVMLAALVACKTSTAHFIARHMWSRPHNRISSIEWTDVQGFRDASIPLALPIDHKPPVTPGLLRISGVASVTPSEDAIKAGTISEEDVVRLGELVEQRCPLAAMVLASGCELQIKWQLTDHNIQQVWPG